MMGCRIHVLEGEYSVRTRLLKEEYEKVNTSVGKRI
jgi:hypothetical protein